MPHTVAEVNAVIESLWPLDAAESWDAPGFLVGDPSSEVSSILLAVDAVADTVSEAVELGADILFVHHPLLLRGVTTVAGSTAKGALVNSLVRANCALIAAHTNADIVERGTSAMLASAINLGELTSLDGEATGLGRVGRLAEPTTLGALAGLLGEVLPPTAGGIRVAGDFDQPVSTVALCGGAGDSYLGHRAVTSADVYITSDLRHHPASEARESAKLFGGPALIDISHWASEWLWLDAAALELRTALPGVTVTVSDIRTDPWDFVVVQNNRVEKLWR